MRRSITPAQVKRFAGSRDLGIEIRARIESALDEGDSVEVDLTGLEDMTPSFADECFGKLAERRGFDVFGTKVFVSNEAPFKNLIDGVVRLRMQRLQAKRAATS